MNIGILTSHNAELRQRLDSDGLSDARAQTAEPAIPVIAEPKPRPIVNVAPSTRFASMRATLDAQIATDVSSGTLSADDAVAVKGTLDQIDDRMGRAGRSVRPSTIAAQYLATIAPGTLVDRFG